MMTGAQERVGGAKLSAAQLRMLRRVPNDWQPWIKQHGEGSFLLNPTRNVLVDSGMVEIICGPPRWRITDLGLAALIKARSES